MSVVLINLCGVDVEIRFHRWLKSSNVHTDHGREELLIVTHQTWPWRERHSIHAVGQFNLTLARKQFGLLYIYFVLPPPPCRASVFMIYPTSIRFLFPFSEIVFFWDNKTPSPVFSLWTGNVCFFHYQEGLFLVIVSFRKSWVTGRLFSNAFHPSFYWWKVETAVKLYQTVLIYDRASTSSRLKECCYKGQRESQMFSCATKRER